jgi:glycosyltransferase involved in cell wall biosynthesis
MTAPHVVHVFPAFSTGGPEVRTCTLINALGDEFRHTVVALNGDTTGVSRLSRPDRITLVPPDVALGPTTLLPFGRQLRHLAPDLLITYGWGGTDALFAALLQRIKRAVHIEDGFLPDEAQGQKPARLVARSLAFRVPHALIVPSRTLERIATSTWRLPAASVRYIPNGIDLDRFVPATPDTRAQARAALGIPLTSTVVGTVAMLRPDKNHARMLRAFSTASAGLDARLVLVGAGDCRPDLEALARSLGCAERVVFTGAITDPAYSYRAFDVFALSSDTEQMPISVLEAMATGLPVMSTDVGDVRDMLGDGAGGVIGPLGDDDAYVTIMRRLMANAELRRSAGESHRRRVAEQFGQDLMVQRYRDAFHEAMRG